jgi:hypothetical protein
LGFKEIIKITWWFIGLFLYYLLFAFSIIWCKIQWFAFRCSGQREKNDT